MVREYLRLTRAHTVPLEAVPAFVGAWLAVQDITVGVIFWTLYGIMYHLSGYGMNSITDWEEGYDKEDEYKQHHPLNTGELSHKKAKGFIFILNILTAALAISLIQFEPLPLIILIVGVVMGVAYNKYGKKTLLKPITISIAHTTVFMVPFISLGGSINSPEFIFGSAFVFLWVLYQIAVSGEIKDIKSDEANVMKHLGYEVDVEEGTYIWPNPTTLLSSIFLKIAGLSLGFIYVSDSPSIIKPILMTVLLILCISDSYRTLDMGLYARGKRIASMSRVEMYTLFIFLFTFMPLTGGVSALTVFGASGLWVLTLNRYLWGTWLAPRV